MDEEGYEEVYFSSPQSPQESRKSCVSWQATVYWSKYRQWSHQVSEILPQVRVSYIYLYTVYRQWIILQVSYLHTLSSHVCCPGKACVHSRRCLKSQSAALSHGGLFTMRTFNNEYRVSLFWIPNLNRTFCPWFPVGKK